MWTVVNLVDRFCDRYDFFIITRNYDSKGDTAPFTTVGTGEWNRVGNAKVYYVEKSRLNASTAARLTNEIAPDGVFLNSALSTPVVNFLFARKKQMVQDVPVVLAPCGELSEGALSVKPLKKKLFLAYAKMSGLFRDVIWKASSRLEFDEIRNVIDRRLDPMIAPDLAPKAILPDFSPNLKPAKERGSVKFMFLSRMVPKKNIRFFLERLVEVRGGNVVFDIVGPLEDDAYWQECLKVIANLPPNIEVKIVEAVSYHEGLKLLCQNHFFVLPTLNENFGYVFLEALAAGCPLMISDQTVWSEIAASGAGWVIALDKPDDWIATINRCVEMESDLYLQMSHSARSFAERWLAETSTEEATAAVLDHAFGSSVEFVQDS